MAIVLSSGGADDIAIALDIYSRATTARRGLPPPDFRLDEIAQSLALPESWLFIKSDGTRPVAIAHLKPSRKEHGQGPLVPGQVFLYLIFVVPERWGEGIGGQLLDFAMADAIARGYRRIHLWTQDDNERSHHLYESRSFARTGRVNHGRSDPHKTVSEWARDLL